MYWNFEENFVSIRYKYILKNIGVNRKLKKQLFPVVNKFAGVECDPEPGPIMVVVILVIPLPV